MDLHYQAESADESGWCALQTACHMGTTESLFNQILTLSSRKHAYDSDGYNLAHIACKRGSRAKKHHLKAILEAGVDINKHQIAMNGKVPTAHTPLMLAARRGNTGLVSDLLALEADANARDYDGWTPMNHAIYSGKLSTVKAFMGTQINWNVTATAWVSDSEEEIKGCNLLHHAVLSNRAKIVQYILSKSFLADIDARTTAGFSAMHLAATRGTPEIIDMLLDAKADIDAEHPPHYHRAIHRAILAGQADNVQLLLRRGCSLATSNDGMTPELCAMKKGNQEIVQILQEHTTRQGTQYLPQ